jgi:hypothetical protein
MKKKRLIILASALVVIAGGSVAAWQASRNEPTTTKNTAKNSTADTKNPATTPAKTADTSSPQGMTASVHHWDQAGFLRASYTRKLTDFTPWEESQVSVKYHDFNGDGVDDAFVWAKIPGTKGYSFAAVWTLESDDQPKELWYLPAGLYVPQYDRKLEGDGTVPNSGKIEDNSALVHKFHWQESTTSKGFVLEPNA